MPGLYNKKPAMVLIPVLIFLIACQSAYFKTMERLGYHKRELLVSRVEDAQKSQKEAKEQFKSALETFSEVLNFQGGELQKKYEKLSTEYDRCESKAQAVRDRIDAVETVAQALFDEWESELDQYNDDNLRRASKSRLEETKSKYSQVIKAMKRAEKRMDPVLSAFHDQVLFLKHNLNAQAIASIRNELASVETDIDSLIKEMEASIRGADAFIEEMTEVSNP